MTRNNCLTPCPMSFRSATIAPDGLVYHTCCSQLRKWSGTTLLDDVQSMLESLDKKFNTFLCKPRIDDFSSSAESW
jgi:hypothetical protein